MHVTERLVRGLIQMGCFKNRRHAMPGKKQEQRPDPVSGPGRTHTMQCALHTCLLLSDLRDSDQVNKRRDLIPEVTR